MEAQKPQHTDETDYAALFAAGYAHLTRLEIIAGAKSGDPQMVKHLETARELAAQ